MQLILIFLSVIMLLISVKSHESIKDLSYECSRGGKIPLTLTTGVGKSDTSIAMISSDQLFNCTLVYSVHSDHYVMVVVQFPEWRLTEKACNHDRNSVLMVSDNNFKENVCENSNSKSDPIYRKLGKGKISVHINNLMGMRAIKLTATSLKDSQGVRCNGREVECSYNTTIYCMNIITHCDGNSNCGVRNLFDEDYKYCDEGKLTIKVVVYTVITGIVLLALFISIALNIMPKNRTFIYKIPEETSLFDPSEDLMSIEIDIDVLFPTQLEEPEPVLQSTDSFRTLHVSPSKKSRRVFKENN